GSDGCDWFDLTPAAGKLFVVGDPKQSIYRFRRADIGLYGRVYGSAPAGQRVALRQNFRSVPAVLHCANHHFSAHLRRDPGAPPVPGVAAHGPGHSVHAVGDRIVDGKAEQVWAAEAAAIARVARRAVDDRWQVRGPDDRPRDATYADLCVLLPTRTNLRRLE